MGVFIQSFLGNQTFRVQIALSISFSFTQYEGVPQRCILSITLFLIAINDMIFSLPLGVRSFLYVDNLAIYTSGSSSSTLQKFINCYIKHLFLGH